MRSRLRTLAMIREYALVLHTLYLAVGEGLLITGFLIRSPSQAVLSE